MIIPRAVSLVLCPVMSNLYCKENKVKASWVCGEPDAGVWQMASVTMIVFAAAL